MQEQTWIAPWARYTGGEKEKVDQCREEKELDASETLKNMLRDR